MPIRVNQIPKPVMPRYTEGSNLRSPRESGDVGRSWIKADDVSAQLAWLTEAVKRLQNDFNRLRVRRGGDDEGGSSPCPLA